VKLSKESASEPTPTSLDYHPTSMGYRPAGMRRRFNSQWISGIITGFIAGALIAGSIVAVWMYRIYRLD
jgi:hypothetical protein